MTRVSKLTGLNWCKQKICYFSQLPEWKWPGLQTEEMSFFIFLEPLPRDDLPTFMLSLTMGSQFPVVSYGAELIAATLISWWIIPCLAWLELQCTWQQPPCWNWTVGRCCKKDNFLLYYETSPLLSFFFFFPLIILESEEKMKRRGQKALPRNRIFIDLIKLTMLKNLPQLLLCWLLCSSKNFSSFTTLWLHTQPFSLLTFPVFYLILSLWFAPIISFISSLASLIAHCLPMW